MDILGLFVEWVSVCPELEVGMGVPREPVRLVGSPSRPRMIAERSGLDWSERMNGFASKRVGALERMNLAGYILKKNSPSCGMERVRVYGKSGVPSRQGRGLFAHCLMERLPLLPVEEEGRLSDPGLRENFVERVFAYHRWRTMVGARPSVGKLVAFHTRHKLALLAHSEKDFRRLGRLVADAKKRPLGEVLDHYGRLFMEALAVRATTRKHTNVLEHMLGYFSSRLTADERAEVLELIRDYHRGVVPLIVPITLVRHYVRKYEVGYLQDQVYLDIDPKELMLKNHV
jgi:uncharacterized protein YbgA (DUF1722 family)/uncharacterized protein YbbK (DUF523 family)